MTVVFLIFENYTLTLIVTTHSLPGHLQIVSQLPGKTDKGTPGGLNARSQRDCLFIPPIPYTQGPMASFSSVSQIPSFPTAASGSSFPLWGPIRTHGLALDLRQTASLQHPTKPQVCPHIFIT